MACASASPRERERRAVRRQRERSRDRDRGRRDGAGSRARPSRLPRKACQRARRVAHLRSLPLSRTVAPLAAAFAIIGDAMRGEPTLDAPPSSLGAIAGVFARYANTTFGGGSATIAVLKEQVVRRAALADCRTVRSELCALAAHARHELARVLHGSGLDHAASERRGRSADRVVTTVLDTRGARHRVLRTAPRIRAVSSSAGRRACRCRRDHGVDRVDLCRAARQGRAPGRPRSWCPAPPRCHSACTSRLS